jgi:hypothetical protein
MAAGTWSAADSEGSLASCGPTGTCAATDGNTWTPSGGWSGATLPPPYGDTGWPVDPEITCGTVCVAYANYDVQGTDAPQGVSALWTLGVGGWSEQATPLPVGYGPSDFIDDLACDNGPSGVCVGWGSATSASGDSSVGFLLAETDGTWSQSQLPLPANAVPDPNDTGPGELTCGVDVCAGVGTYEDTSGSEVNDLYAYENGTWSVTPLPDAPSLQINDWDVSCTDDGTCLASVADEPSAAGSPMVWELAGGTWSAVTQVLGSEYPIYLVNSQSCGPDGTCTIAAETPGGSEVFWTLVNGTWSPQAVPLPPGAVQQGNSMTVSCGSSGVCMGIGTYSLTSNPNGGFSAAVWVSRDGSRWRFALLPLLAGSPAGTIGYPDTVSCGWGAGATCALAGEEMTDTSASVGSDAVLWSATVGT